MTREEWINNDNRFYHITHTRNLHSIYDNGLENRNGRGICVVRTNDDRVVRYICEMMLNSDNDINFSVLEIVPSQINLQVSEILVDGVSECTNPLHNYIRRQSIPIGPENVAATYQANPLGIPNVEEYEAMLRQEFHLEQLT